MCENFLESSGGANWHYVARVPHSFSVVLAFDYSWSEHQTWYIRIHPSFSICIVYMGHQEDSFCLWGLEAPCRSCLFYHKWHFLPSSSIGYKLQDDLLLCFPPPLHCFLATASVFSGKAWRKQAVSSSFHYSLEHTLAQELEVIPSKPQLSIHVHHLPARHYKLYDVVPLFEALQSAVGRLEADDS